MLRSSVLCRMKRQAESSLKGITGRSQHTASEGWTLSNMGCDSQVGPKYCNTLALILKALSKGNIINNCNIQDKVQI